MDVDSTGEFSVGVSYRLKLAKNHLWLIDGRSDRDPVSGNVLNLYEGVVDGHFFFFPPSTEQFKSAPQVGLRFNLGRLTGLEPASFPLCSYRFEGAAITSANNFI